MRQIELIPEIKRLCGLREYNEAFILVTEIANVSLSIKVHLLCVEHQAISINDKVEK